ncbi:S8 family serine peptidase [Pseudofrankia saprophytica]|nr:S8 family serine peptidase [Pseudofrankia saprophytica]
MESNPKGKSSPSSASASARSTASGRSASRREVERRHGRYLVGAAPRELLPAGVSVADPKAIFERLKTLPDVTFHRELAMSTNGPLATFGTGAAQPSKIAVFEMPEDRAAALRQAPDVLIEPDRRLNVADPALGAAGVLPDPGRLATPGETTSLSFTVQGRDGTGVAGATVLVQGRNFPVQGITDQNGRVSVTLIADTPGTIQNVYVRPASDYWERSIDRPRLSASEDNVIALEPLSQLMPDFPSRQQFTWGQRAMGIDRIPPTYRGDGVKIALIDSGVDVNHPDLKGRITAGFDLVDRAGRHWDTDEVGHGTHCAGTVTGADNGRGIIGIVPGAEIHVCKIFPGGRFSDLIEALDYCIQQKIDIVNLSLGADAGSIFVSRKIEEARQAGVACIVAAGNVADQPVRFPGSLPTVFTVAALGKADTFPADSNHAEAVIGQPTLDGYFPARFSCVGPEIDAVAPGVAIVSSVPGGGYAALDGTSMAAPHVTGLAGLILAHRADFRRPFVNPAERVQRLFDVLMACCRPLPEFGPGRAGAGLPDATQALGLAMAPAQIPRVAAPGAQVMTEVQLLLGTLRSAMERAGLSAASVV